MSLPDGLDTLIVADEGDRHNHDPQAPLDTTSAVALVRRFTDNFWSIDWPGRARPIVYYDPRSLELDGPTGVLHAKAVIADGEAVFITSANVTEAALDRNIETGLLVRDRTLASTVAAHFRGLIDKNLLHPLPAN